MKWIKAKDRLPPDEFSVQTFKSNGMNFTGWYHKEENVFEDIMAGKFPIDDIQWLDESEQDEGWVPVGNPEKLLDLDGTYHFLIHVVDSSINREYWQIITGWIQDGSGDLHNQHDDEYAGWNYRDVIYYKPVGNLPKLPSKD